MNLKTGYPRPARQPRAMCKILLALGIGLSGSAGMVVATPAPAQAQFISERQEMEAGRQAAAEVESKMRIVTGTRDAQMVERIGRQMASVSGRPGLPWQFRVVEDKSLNAFSLPGYVYVNTGLLDATRNDRDALAGVIAHEVAHVDARHSKKQMEKGALAGLLGSLIVRDKKQAGWFNIAGGLVMMKFSRDDEYDADSRAVRYLQRTGYDPRGMVRFFRKLEKMEGKGSKNLTFFRTHPNSGDRVSRIERQIGSRAAARR